MQRERGILHLYNGVTQNTTKTKMIYCCDIWLVVLGQERNVLGMSYCTCLHPGPLTVLPNFILAPFLNHQIQYIPVETPTQLLLGFHNSSFLNIVILFSIVSIQLNP